MRESFAVLSLLLGIAFPLLLNGRPFSNNLMGIAFALVAAALILGKSRRRRAEESGLGAGDRVVVGLAVLLALALAVQLPSAYRFQVDFNRKVKEIRRARGNGARSGAFRSPPSPTIPDQPARHSVGFGGKVGGLIVRRTEV